MIASPETQRTPDSTAVSSPAEVTPVHVRTSRRLQGLQPEHGPLADRSRMMNLNSQTPAAGVAPVQQYIVNQPQTPTAFHGDPTEDVDDWLDHFDRVAACNGWNEDGKLRRVRFKTLRGRGFTITKRH